MNNTLRQAVFIGIGVFVLMAAILMLTGTPTEKQSTLLGQVSLANVLLKTKTLFPAVDSFMQAYDNNRQIPDTLSASVIPFGSRPKRVISTAAPAALATLFVKGILLQDKPLAIFENAQGVSTICGQGDSIAGMVVKSIRPGQVTVAGPRGVYEIPVNQ